MTRTTGYVIAPQAAIEITTDEYGDVTLVQNGVSVVIRAANLATLAEIIIDIDNGRNAFDDEPIDVDGPDVEVPPTAPKHPKDPTAAERQRRYRERKRNGVTARNGNRDGDGDAP